MQQSKTENWSKLGEDCRSRSKSSMGCLSSTHVPRMLLPLPVPQRQQMDRSHHNTLSGLSKREASSGKTRSRPAKMMDAWRSRAQPRERSGDGGGAREINNRQQYPRQRHHLNHLQRHLRMECRNSHTQLITRTFSRSIRTTAFQPRTHQKRWHGTSSPPCLKRTGCSSSATSTRYRAVSIRTRTS